MLRTHCAFRNHNRMTDPLIGKQLANFRIERLLGQGATATVYFGQDVKLHRPVAIKVLDKRYKKHPAYAARFVNEARMMAKWRHENIIQIYYADDAQGMSYYVMDYVDGKDLSTYLDSHHYQGKLISTDEVLRIGNAIASALDYAHAQGVIHRDVKPSNILLSTTGGVLLGDFGMALEVGDGTQGNAFGTPHYISPEQARRSADAIPQSDLYSFGVILYEMLVGMVPFNDDSPEEIALKHIAQPAPSPRSVNQNLSTEVEAVLLKALEKNPNERYQSGAKLMQALEDALRINTPPKKLSLPPLPAGVPTIRRDDDPTSKFAKRKSKQLATPLPPTVFSANQNRKNNYWVYALVGLFLVGILSLFLGRNLFGSAENSNAPTVDLTLQPTGLPVLATDTFAQPEASATSTITFPTSTFTPIPPPSATATLATPTVLYPDGNLFKLFYNETSFFMVNSSFAKRTLSGFSFERLDDNGNPLTDRFDGYRWENPRTAHLPRNYCANITIYGDQDPQYLNPSECIYAIINTVQPRFDNPGDLLFWTPKPNSTQFRVLWVGEEVARCTIASGSCEFYVP